jgi:hypothetical protein
MNVAVGRLHLSITMATPAREKPAAIEREARDSLEHAFNSDRNHQAVESDKHRWATENLLRNGMRQ